jgi:hypothetical protein
MKDYLKFKLEGAAEAIINLHKGLDPKLNVKAFAYYNNLSKTIDVTLYWNSGYNIDTNEEVEMSKDFTDIQDFNEFCFEVWNFIDELEKTKYDENYIESSLNDSSEGDEYRDRTFQED